MKLRFRRQEVGDRCLATSRCRIFIITSVVAILQLVHEVDEAAAANNPGKSCSEATGEKRGFGSHMCDMSPEQLLYVWW